MERLEAQDGYRRFQAQFEALLSPKEEIELAKRVNWRISLQLQIVSLEEPVGEGTETLGDFIADEKTPSPEEQAYQALMREELDRALDHLSEREKQIIELHFGLKYGQSLSLAEVARRIGLSPEWVRQIEDRALDKLRLFFSHTMRCECR